MEKDKKKKNLMKFFLGFTIISTIGGCLYIDYKSNKAIIRDKEYPEDHLHHTELKKNLIPHPTNKWQIVQNLIIQEKLESLEKKHQKDIKLTKYPCRFCEILKQK